MKATRWVFLLLIVIVGLVLWRVYTLMPNKTAVIHNQAQVGNIITPAPITPPVQLPQPQGQNFAIEEIYYYLNIAHLQLSVLHDVNTAMHIMKWAQKRLIENGAPMTLQEALSADILDLETAATPHIMDITQKIAGIEAQINVLPLRRPQGQTTTATNTQTTGWRGALHNAWLELKSLIRIQPRNTSIDYVLFDATILRETVRVELQRASIAAVIGQTDLYKASIQQATIAFQQFFAPEQSVEEVIKLLQILVEYPVVVCVPKFDWASL